MARSMPLVVVVAMLLGMAAASPTHAATNHARINPESEWRKPENAAALPQYCRDRLDKEGRWKKWKDYFGKVYGHMHHYCGGVYAETRAKTTVKKRERDMWLHATVSEMRYVARYCDRDCVLYHDLYRRWAWALGEQGKTAEAAQKLQMLNAVPRVAPMPGSAPTAAPATRAPPAPPPAAPPERPAAAPAS